MCSPTAEIECLGDYGEFAMTSAGNDRGRGRGLQLDGPGGAWFNRET